LSIDFQTLGLAYVAVLVTLELIFWAMSWRLMKGFVTVIFGDEEDEQ
jgi:hypothetical protein